MGRDFRSNGPHTGRHCSAPIRKGLRGTKYQMQKHTQKKKRAKSQPSRQRPTWRGPPHKDAETVQERQFQPQGAPPPTGKTPLLGLRRDPAAWLIGTKRHFGCKTSLTAPYTTPTEAAFLCPWTLMYCLRRGGPRADEQSRRV